MPLRMYVYLGRIWERYLEHNPNADHLLTILPIVLHHSEHGWSAPTTLRALIDADDDLAKPPPPSQARGAQDPLARGL